MEALTSTGAFKYLQNRSNILSALERSFSTEASKLENTIASLQQDIKKKNKEITKLADQIQVSQAKSLFGDITKLTDDLGVAIIDLKGKPAKELRSFSDKFIDQNQKDLLFIFTVEDDKISYLLRTHKSNKKIHCGQTLKNCQEVVSGKGGGKPDMAQGSGQAKNKDLFIEAIKKDIIACIK